MCHFIYYPNNNFFSIRQAGSVCFFVSVGILGILSSTLFTPLQSTIITAQHFLSTTRFYVLVKSGIIESQWFIYIPTIIFYELFIYFIYYYSASTHYADYDLWGFMSADVPPRSHAWPHIHGFRSLNKLDRNESRNKDETKKFSIPLLLKQQRTDKLYIF